MVKKYVFAFAFLFVVFPSFVFAEVPSYPGYSDVVQFEGSDSLVRTFFYNPFDTGTRPWLNPYPGEEYFSFSTTPYVACDADGVSNCTTINNDAIYPPYISNLLYSSTDVYTATTEGVNFTIPASTIDVWEVVSESILNSETFLEFVSLVVGLLPVIVGLVVSIIAFTYILNLLRRYLNAPDTVSEFARKTMRENDSIMADLKKRER